MAIKILNEIDLNYSISLILFHPTVTKEELIENVRLIEELNLADKIENIFNYLRLIPGTHINPSTNSKEWRFEDKRIAHILDNCLVYSNKKSSLPTNINLNSQNINEYIGNLKKVLFDASNIKKNKLKFLKKELGIIENMETDSYEMNKFDTLIFKINPNINIECSKSIEMYECYNNSTGLRYILNKLAMTLMNVLNGNTLEYLVECIFKEYKHQNITLFDDILEGLVSLLANQILICEVSLNSDTY